VVLRNTLAAAVIKGLRDEQKRRHISFALSGTKYDFAGGVDKIKAAYRCIGEPDPFKPKDGNKLWGSNNPFWSAPGGMGPPTVPVMNAMGPPQAPFPVMAAIGHRRTSSYDSGQQQRMDTAGRPATSDGLTDMGLPSKLSQEEFNQYMDAYMRRQKGQDFQTPSQGSIATAPAVRGPNQWITCFSCGQRGHRSVGCSATRLSWEDQLKVGERVALEVQEYRNRRQLGPGVNSPTPASATDTISLIRMNPVMEGSANEGDGVGTPHVMPRVNNVQLVRMGNSRASMEALAMLQRVPGVMEAIRNAAMAVKRTQEEAGMEPEDAGKMTQRKVESHEPVTAPEVVIANAAPEDPTAIETVEDPVHGIPSGTGVASADLKSLKELISQEVDKAIQRTTRQDNTVLRAPSIPIATKPRTYAPIKLLRNEPKYDLETFCATSSRRYHCLSCWTYPQDCDRN
jgi:hypothetical protein